MYDIWNKRRKEVSFLLNQSVYYHYLLFLVETAVVEKSYTKNFPFFYEESEIRDDEREGAMSCKSFPNFLDF